jgi:biotin transporter BioY
VGIQCQLVLISAQGLFAQVLPVPRGRSIRGSGAMAGGGFLLGWVVFSVVAVLLRSEEMRGAPVVLGVISLACLAGAVVTYVWCWPTAVRDFDSRAR